MKVKQVGKIALRKVSCISVILNMKLNYYTLFIVCIFIACENKKATHNTNIVSKETPVDYEIINAYALKYNNTLLYGNYEDFTKQNGLPDSIWILKNTLKINSKIELDKFIHVAKEPNIITLFYRGIAMWYAYNNNVIPLYIDFRKTEKSIIYEKTKFDNNYTIEDFKNQFPYSYNNPIATVHSLFSTMKDESGNYIHFILKRKSRTDVNEEPIIEFTFENGKLILIFFANF